MASVIVLVLLLMQFKAVFGELCIHGRGGGCELYCQQTSNSTRVCSCGSLGEIKPDNISCYYKPRLMFGQDGAFSFLKSAKVFGVHRRTETIKWDDAIKEGGKILSLAPHYNDRLVFYTSKRVDGTRAISSVGYINLHSRTHEEILQNENALIYGVAYDSMTKNLYYTLSTGEIMVISDYHSAVSSVNKLFATMETPKDIQIDPVASLMFVVDISSKEIVRFSLTTGSKIAAINTSSHIPECIALDLVAEKLFWVGRNVGEQDKIEMANYDGSCRRLLKPVNSIHPFSMTFWDGSLFWSDVLEKKIYETNVSNGNTVDSNIVLEDSAFSIQYFGHKENFTGEWSQWVSGENLMYRTCKRMRVRHYNAMCLSPQREGKFTCVGVSTKENPQRDSQTNDGAKTSNTTYIALGVTIAVCACLFLVILVILWLVYRRRRRRRRRRRSRNPEPEPIYAEIPELSENEMRERKNIVLSKHDVVELSPKEGNVSPRCSRSLKHDVVELPHEEGKVRVKTAAPPTTSRSSNLYTDMQVVNMPPLSPSQQNDVEREARPANHIIDNPSAFNNPAYEMN